MINSPLAKLYDLALNNSLAHAWLCVGDHGHKLQQIQDFSQWLLCSSKQGFKACGLCKQCALFAAVTHPDFCKITIKEDNSGILVDDLRELNNFIKSKPQFARNKVVLLFPAEKMNKQAANALLKNLEEPGPDTFIFLLSAHADLLLPTIVSRCQIIRFNTQTSAQDDSVATIEQFLNNLRNLWVTKTVTPVELATLLVKSWPDEVLYWFELVLADLLKCRYTRDPSVLKYPTLHSSLVAVLNRVDVKKLWDMLSKVQQARFWAGRGAKPNLQLILEDVVLS
jgi:hypothetical protein